MWCPHSNQRPHSGRGSGSTINQIHLNFDGYCAFGLKSAHTIKMRLVGELASSHVRVGEPHTPSSKCGSGSAPDHGGERTLLTRTWQLFMSPADSAGAGGGIVGRQSRVAFDF